MKKYIFIRSCMLLSIVVCMMFSITVCAEQNTNDKVQDKQKQIENSFEKFTGYNNEIVVDSITSDKDNVIFNIFDIIFEEIRQSLGLVLQILAIAIIQALISNIGLDGISGTRCKPGLGSGKSALDVASIVCTIGMIAIAINSSSLVFQSAEEIVAMATDFLKSTFPLMVSLTAMSGGANVSVAISPMLFFVSETVVFVISTIIFPLLSVSLAFAVADVFSDKKLLKGIVSFLRKTCYWIIGIISVVFTSVTAVKGITGAATGIGGSRVIKTFIKFIPVAGDLISDSLETIVGGIAMIKSVSGVVVIVGIAIIAGLPVIKMFVIGIIYKVAAMLADSLGAEQGAIFIKEAGNTIIAASSMVLAVGVMFVVIVASLISFSM